MQLYVVKMFCLMIHYFSALCNFKASSMSEQTQIEKLHSTWRCISCILDHDTPKFSG